MRTQTFVIIAAVAAIIGSRAHAQTTAPATAPAAAITLVTGVEEGKKVLQAKIVANGKPVPDVSVTFHVRRTFGELQIGTDQTDDQGTAAIPFPADIPGGPAGEIRVIARATKPAPYAALSAEQTFNGATVVPEVEDVFPRALWAPRAPFALIASIVTILAVVWVTYAYVVVQLYRLYKGAKK